MYCCVLYCCIACIHSRNVLPAGYTKAKLDKFNEDLNPSLAMVTDWIISSGNTPLSVDMMVGSLDLMQRDDIIEVIQKGRGKIIEVIQKGRGKIIEVIQKGRGKIIEVIQKGRGRAHSRV